MCILNILGIVIVAYPPMPGKDKHSGFTHGGRANPYQNPLSAIRRDEMMASSKGSPLLRRGTNEDLYSIWPKQRNNPSTEHLLTGKYE